ncbi:MAG: ArsR family transcriptional regulator [Propionibacteriaceae bacterium]|jgi:predicted nucleotidyltransferase|nr:ArsR family transcriptional regulator [Propionibacteriaceae bacterium]
MNTTASRLAPIFRSDTQAEIMARLLLNPDRSHTIAELARLVGASYASAHREIQRLLEIGLLTPERVGQAVRLCANQADPAYGPITELLRLSYGPAAILPKLLAGIPGIEEAYIYGSWAARRAGEPGSPPGDIDVLVIGNPPRGAINEAAQEAERALGREVNLRTVTPEAWQASDDLFLRTVRKRPRVRLELEDGT